MMATVLAAMKHLSGGVPLHHIPHEMTKLTLMLKNAVDLALIVQCDYHAPQTGEEVPVMERRLLQAPPSVFPQSQVKVWSAGYFELRSIFL